MKFELLDPRPVGKEANDKVLSQDCLGIEVTIPALAKGCTLGNIDPQHSGSDITTAAIEAVVHCSLPPVDATLVTVRADLDSVGAMAVLTMRAQGIELSEEIKARIGVIADFDKFSNSGWTGPKEVPSRNNPWPDAREKSLSAMNLAVMDFKSTLSDRVALMQDWLQSGSQPEKYVSLAEAARESMISALEKGEISYEINDGIAVVHSAHMAGTTIGYCLSPIVMLQNPKFRFQGGEPHVKFTICQLQAGLVDLMKVKEELSSLEAGWGGSPTIIGSPQGVSSLLSLEQVMEVVIRNKK